MSHPLSGIRVVEMGSGTAVPYLAKLFVDAGASVVKVESPAGDPFRRWSASGADIADGEDAAWFRFLNAGKSSVVVDLDAPGGRDELADLVGSVDLVLDDHAPADARRLDIDPDALRAMRPRAVVATLTPFGTTGPWADRPANDFVLEALVGSIEGRGIPGREPAHVGGHLGEFVAAAFAGPPVLAITLAARVSGRGRHVDLSTFEAMTASFQTYRAIYRTFMPNERSPRQIEVPAVEPASDGWVGFATVTGQQWSDFCVMIGAPDLGEQEDLLTNDGRMRRRDELLERIHAFTRRHTVDELTDLASAFRIPTGPIGTGDRVARFDHFVERGVFVENPHGFTQPRPAYRFSQSELAPVRPAPALGAGEAPTADPVVVTARLGDDPDAPLAGLRVVDLSAFWAGPVAANVLRVLGAEVVKVESHVRLDGMRWAGARRAGRPWEWSPVYHGANAGKTTITVDLGTAEGRTIVEDLVARSDLVIENFSPRVTEGWGLTWDRIRELNPRASFVRVPAFGLDGPWRDRLGFAMTMEQVSGLASRTGHVDDLPWAPRGPVDSLAGMHAVFGAVLALAERDRLGVGQLVEAPLIEGALQAAAEQVVEFSAYGGLLNRTGNRAPGVSPQGIYETVEVDRWVAVGVETDDQWHALCGVVDGLDAFDRHDDHDAIDAVLTAWASERDGELAAATLVEAGVPAAPCLRWESAPDAAQHDFRRYHQWYEHPVCGWVPYSSLPFLLDGRRLPLGGPAPVLGQHTEAVLAGLGRDAESVERLRESGVIGDWPAGVERRDQP